MLSHNLRGFDIEVQPQLHFMLVGPAIDEAQYTHQKLPGGSLASVYHLTRIP
jgi:hypothetical protein